MWSISREVQSQVTSSGQTLNKDGIQDSNEGGIENITITLYSEGGDTLATDILTLNGRYEFCNPR